MPRPNKKRQAAALNLVAANAAKQDKKLERDAQKAALADRIANIKEMPTKSTLDLKDLLSGDIGCSCSECGPDGRGGSNGLISAEMLKAKGALSKKGPRPQYKKRQFSALTAKFGLKITFPQQLDVRGGYQA